MTAEEREFATLLDAYLGAQTVYQMATATNAKPEYVTEKGHITPASISSYKKDLAAYEQRNTELSEAKQKLQEAKQALDDYFSPAVVNKFNQGVSMLANIPGGVAALLKEKDEYLVFKGRDQSDVRSKLESRPPR